MNQTTKASSSLDKIKMNNIRIDLKKISARIDAALAKGKKPFLPPIEEVIGNPPEIPQNKDFNPIIYGQDLIVYYSTAASIEQAIAKRIQKKGS